MLPICVEIIRGRPQQLISCFVVCARRLRQAAIHLPVRVERKVLWHHQRQYSKRSLEIRGVDPSICTGAGTWPSRFDPASSLTIRRRVRRPDRRNLGLSERVKYRNVFVLETRVN